MNPDWLQWPQTRKLVAAFAKKDAPLRFVGGAVRDALLGKPVQDVDAATPLPPEAVIALLDKARIKTVPTGIAHGTVTAIIDGKPFEITTLRRDTACDGRHAEVAFTGDWQEDAARRDFTMNALYLSPQGEFFDYFAGGEDAQAGQVRFIGDPAGRIAEDFLRILRFFRFHAWYGKGEADAAALDACAAAAEGMDTLSGERIQAELLKLLAAPSPSHSLQLMQQRQLLQHMLGFELRDCDMFTRFEAIEALTGIVLPAAIKLAGFLFAIGAHMTREEVLEIMSQRLRLSTQMLRDLQIFARHHKTIHPALKEAAQKRALRHLGKQHFIWLAVINWAAGKDSIDAGHPYIDMLTLAEQWQPPEFPVNGRDLIRLGMKPGEEMGALLRELEDEWEDSDYTLTREALLRMVKGGL
jgi:poly(A) polymerase